MYQWQYKNQAVTDKKKKKNTNLCVENFIQIAQCELFYADFHGNLKLRLNKPIKNKIVYPFSDKQELSHLFKKFKWNIDGLELEEEVNGGMY